VIAAVMCSVTLHLKRAAAERKYFEGARQCLSDMFLFFRWCFKIETEHSETFVDVKIAV
jgi:hypothetical protein